MRALLTAVGYHDLLALCLPYNAHHFSEILVVTTPEDTATQAVVAAVPNASCHLTQAFYPAPGVFAKWAALEEGLDVLGRRGWVALLDADVCWPKGLRWEERTVHPSAVGGSVTWQTMDCVIPGVGVSTWVGGNLYGPLRRMHEAIPAAVPPEETWDRYPLHRQQHEHAGFSLIFHASDPHLGPPPWFDTRWVHCGGGDSEFQSKWGPECKVRPPWHVLHFGAAGTNWLGRSTPFADGTVPADASDRVAELWRLIRMRRPGPDRFRHEKLP